MSTLAITYLNRLSDLLFILTRVVNGTGGDVLWVPGVSEATTRRWKSPSINQIAKPPNQEDAMISDARGLKEATGKAEPAQPRPVTLFTGQWADLPFEEICRLAAGWGHGNLEIACWGDHFDVVKAVENDNYLQGHPGTFWSSTGSAVGRSPTTSMARRCVRRSSTSATRTWSTHASGVTVIPRAFGSGPPRR